MTNRNYQNGRAFEWRVADLLRKHGYTVIRAAGSKGPADLVAVKPGQVLMVQCKRDGKMGPKERAAFMESVRVAGCIGLLAYMPGIRGVAFKQFLSADETAVWVYEESEVVK